MFVERKKVIIVDPPDGFPSQVDTNKFGRFDQGTAVALAMGEYMRSKTLQIPSGILFEEAPQPK